MMLQNETTHIPTTLIMEMAHLCFVEMISSLEEVFRNVQIIVILIMITMEMGHLCSVEVVDLLTNQGCPMLLGESNIVLMGRHSTLE